MIPDEPGTISRPKNSILTQKKRWFWNQKFNGAKHSPSPLPLDRPLADSGGPRAIAWYWPFDPTLLIDILDRLINPQKYPENYVRALSWLNMSSIGPREESLRTGNVSQKVSKFWWNFEFLTGFSEMIPDQPWTVPRPKNSIFMQNSMIFK